MGAHKIYVFFFDSFSSRSLFGWLAVAGFHCSISIFVIQVALTHRNTEKSLSLLRFDMQRTQGS